jgi:hypothetical protein
METARQLITATLVVVTKTDRTGALGCGWPSIPRHIMAAAVIGALATYVSPFASAVFAQPASDSLGELLTGKAALRSPLR